MISARSTAGPPTELLKRQRKEDWEAKNTEADREVGFGPCPLRDRGDEDLVYSPRPLCQWRGSSRRKTLNSEETSTWQRSTYTSMDSIPTTGRSKPLLTNGSIYRGSARLYSPLTQSNRSSISQPGLVHGPRTPRQHTTKAYIFAHSKQHL